MVKRVAQNSRVWTLATEYPSTNISGVALLSLAEEIKRDHQTVAIEVLTEQPGLTSYSIAELAALGEITGGDLYVSALSRMDPIFAIPALPFHVASYDHAKRMYARCLPAYKKALQTRGLHHLFTTFWPATGLWSDRPIDTIETLRALKLRTNDPASADVFRDVGTDATFMPFSEAVGLLKVGRLNAVLTSGDGGAGQKLWDYLRFFTPLHYAFPFSFTCVNMRSFEALSSLESEQVKAAASRAEAAQADRLSARIKANFARMQDHGVKIAPFVPSALREQLNAVGRIHTQAWMTRLPNDVQALVHEN